MKRSFATLAAALTLAFGAVALTSAQAATFTVTTLSDAGAGSLRQAIADANLAVGADTILFGLSGTITLASTLPSITDVAGLAIDGAGQTVTISGNNAVLVMQVAVGATLSLNNLTIANGAGSSGGGLQNAGTSIVANSTFSGNSASFGGAINNASNVLSVTNSTFSNNTTSGGFGGAIYNNGTAVTVTNSTFSGNSAPGGFGGALLNNAVAGFTVRNSIVANSAAGGNCSGAIANGGNNIDSGTTCGWLAGSGSMSSTSPLLGALASNGGPTQTFALQVGSPAINGVTFNAPNSAPAFDQRGIARPQSGGYDIGAYELAAVVVPVAVATPIPAVNVWAMAILMLVVGLGAVGFTKKRAS